MKKYCYIFFILGLLTISNFSTAQEQFERRYPLNQTNVETAAITSAGNGYITLGVQINNDEEREHLIVSLLNQKGNIGTNISVSYRDTVHIKDAGDIILLSDRNIVFSAVLDKDSSNKVITLMTPEGNVAWTTITGQTSDTKGLDSGPSTLLEAAPNKIFHAHNILGEDNTTDIQLTRLSTLGDIEFNKKVAFSSPTDISINERFLKMHLGIDSTIMILGTTDDSQAPLFLTKMDTAGNVIWSKSYNGDFGRTLDIKGCDMIQLLDSTWVVVASVLPNATQRNGGVLLNIDEDGDLLRTESIRPTSSRYQLYPNGIQGTLDTTVILSFIREDMISQTFQPLIIKYDMDSIISYQTLLDTSISSDPELIGLVTIDSISSTIQYSTTKDGFVIPNLTKVDEDGRTQCEEFVDAIIIDSVNFVTGTLNTSSQDVTTIDSITFQSSSFGRFTPPILSIQDTTFCPNDPIVYLVDASVRGAIEYMWDDGNGDSVRVFTEEGMFSVTVTVREDLCFNLCDTLTISVLNPIEVSIGKTNNLCTTGDFILSANIMGASAVSTLWSTGSTENNIVVPGEIGDYSVTVVDGCGISADASTSITQAELIPPVVADITRNCQTLSVTGTGFISQEWSTGDTSSTTDIFEAGTYSVVLLDQCGVEQTPLQIQVSPDDLPEPIEVDIALDCGAPPTLRVVGSGFNSQIWNTGETSETIEISEPGNYSVTVTGPEQDGCELSRIESETLQQNDLDNTSGCLIWPNAFRPDGPDLEDQTFAPTVRAGCENLESYEINIFNRWGKKVFSSTSTSVGWNGAIDGDRQSGGVYFYWAKYNDGNSECERRGDITLIR